MVIAAESLDLGYGDRLVLRDLAFQVAEGEFVGLLGPNGSGKSTLLRAISGLLPSRQGRLTLKGREITALSSRQRAQAMAVVPQSVEVRFPYPCLEVVLMGRYPYRRVFSGLTEDDLLKALEAMRWTTTHHFQDRIILEVSGGERQRVVMARALAQDTQLLLLDEATSSLDVRKKLEIFELLLELNQTRGLTVVAAMHDLNLAALTCRRLIFLKDGRIAADGPTEEVFTAATLHQVYDSPMEVIRHAGTQRPYAVMLPLREGPGERGSPALPSSSSPNPS